MSARIVEPYAELAPLLEAERRRGARIGLTNGCFDVLHVGHVRLMREGAALVDAFVVALNSDASARGNKGPDRPFVPLAERMEVVAALEGVDYVTSFDAATAHALLETLRPDVYVKGRDRTPETVPEADLVQGYGGRLAFAGDPKDHSSTELIERIRGGRS